MEFKSGFVSIVGRTNVGKSTILNSIIGEKIAAVANKPETTRGAIRGIINRANSQIIFTDTPGIHKPKSKFGEAMNDTAYSFSNDCDVVIMVIQPDRAVKEDTIDKGNQLIIDKLKETNKKAILIINKVDLIKNKEDLFELIKLYQDIYNFEAVIPISAENMTENDKETVITEIEKCLEPGPKYYDEDEFTDQTMREIVEEIVREKALKLLRDEVPHGIYVECTKMKMGKTMKNEKIFNTDCTIYCIRDSHKGIIIGKGGEMLKRIGTYAREDLEKNFGTKINLSLFVKVDKDWMDNQDRIKKLMGKYGNV